MRLDFPPAPNTKCSDSAQNLAQTAAGAPALGFSRIGSWLQAVQSLFWPVFWP